MMAGSAKMIKSVNILSNYELKKVKSNYTRDVVDLNTPGVVWPHIEKRPWNNNIKGMNVMADWDNVSSAGILTENLTSMALLQKNVSVKPTVMIGIMIGMRPLYMKPMKRLRRMTAHSDE